MNNYGSLIRLRTRKLGALIYDARIAKKKSPDECAAAMKVMVELYDNIEKGIEAPSLPMIEMFAYTLDIPLEHFWGDESLVETLSAKEMENTEQLRQLRDRFIAAHVRQQRNEGNISLADLSAKTTLSEERLQQYELGQISIPLPELEIIASELSMQLEDLLDRRGPVGNWLAEKETIQELMAMPPDLRDFVCKPVNRPYLELAQRLSALDVNKLRTVAEGLLEITY